MPALPRSLVLCAVLLARAATGAVYSGRHVVVDAGDNVCNVFSFGAVGDGRADDTAALQRAIAACATAAGGTTLLPSNGTFLSFMLTVPPSARGFALRVEGVLRFSNDTERWPKAAPACLVVGGAHIALVGHGVIDGQGAAWWPCAKAGCPRPDLVLAQGVTDLLVANTTFIDSPNHQLELYASPQELDRVTILAPDSANVPVPSHNTDGVDVHGNPAYIHDCHISVGDDHVAIHASDTLVENCVFGTGHGASIGSLGYATALTNITVRNSSFDGAVQALRIKADTQSSGWLRDVLYADLTLKNCALSVMLVMNYGQGGASNSTMQLSNISFVNIHASGAVSAAGQLLCSERAPCRGLVVSNVTHATKPASAWACEYAHGTTSGSSPSPTCLLP